MQRMSVKSEAMGGTYQCLHMNLNCLLFFVPAALESS